MDSPEREPLEGALPPGVRSEIETWFARRGVPQLIDDFTTERSMDARARILVVAWLIVGSLFRWGSRSDTSFWANLAGGLLVLASVAVGVAWLRWVRNKVMWWKDRDLDAFDTFSIGPFVAIPSGLLASSWGDGVRDGFDALIGMGVIYIVVGLGLGEIAWWGLKRLRDEVAQIISLLARTLPVLLILVLFLLFAAELWEAAHLLTTGELLIVIGVLGLVAVLLLFTTFRVEVRSFQSAEPERIRQLAEGTPIGPFADQLRAPVVPQLRVLQRLNLSALVVLSQLIQSTFVALLVAGFLMVFGLVVLPPELQERWIGAAVTTIFSFEMLGDSRQLTVQLMTTSCLLGSVVGLYFTGLAVTESAYREAHFDRILEEARQVLATHALYVSALRTPSR